MGVWPGPPLVLDYFMIDYAGSRAGTTLWIAELPTCSTLHCLTVCELFADFYYYSGNDLQCFFRRQKISI